MNTTIAEFIASKISRLGKTQREIAKELGYDQPNIISMFKTGTTKIPLQKIPQLATALEIDPALLFRMAMEQYWPDIHDTVTQVFGGIITRNERSTLDAIRAATGGEDPPVTEEIRRELQRVYGDQTLNGSTATIARP